MSVLKQDKPWLAAIYIGGAGFMLAAYIAIGYFAAKLVVGHFSVPRYWLAAGCMAGLVFGIVHIALLIKRFLGETNG